ncbi:MAG: PEP-CTERM sorting domain-containing protein [Candidatus Omnitrophota bacterium]|nr:PEP-CTERM sorting domain-containing protein [Candidatus Omnitrophota bacterium]
MMKLLIALVAAAVMVMPSVASANVLGDSGFEGTGAGPWISDNWGGPWTNDYDATDQIHAGAQSLKQVANGTNVLNKWEKAEAKQIFAVQPGDVVNGGVWMKWANISNAEAFLESKWLNASQAELGSGIGTVHKTSGSGDWEFQDLGTWTEAQRTAPVNAAYVDYRLVFLSAGNADIATGTVWFDDANFTVIPEPTSMLLLGSGLIGLFGFCRKKLTK